MSKPLFSLQQNIYSFYSAINLVYFCLCHIFTTPVAHTSPPWWIPFLLWIMLGFRDGINRYSLHYFSNPALCVLKPPMPYDEALRSFSFQGLEATNSIGSMGVRDVSSGWVGSVSITAYHRLGSRYMCLVSPLGGINCAWRDWPAYLGTVTSRHCAIVLSISLCWYQCRFKKCQITFCEEGVVGNVFGS